MTTTVTHDSLMKRSNRIALRMIVDDTSRLIDASILNSHESGMNEIVFELPTVFHFKGFTVADAQLLVYTEIIKRYREKGFEDIRISLKTKKIIIIRWVNGMTESERRDCRTLLDEYIVRQ